MINIETIENWKNEENNGEKLYLLAIGFDESKRNKYLSQGYFDIENKIPDKEVSAKKLSEIIENIIGKQFVAKLENPKFAWNPKHLFANIECNEIETFFSQYKNLMNSKKEYFGKIEINSIYVFLKTFLDYPQKYNYKDIEIYSKISDFVLNISSHGTFWIIGKDKVVMQQLFLMLNKQNFIVLKGNENEF